MGKKWTFAVFSHSHKTSCKVDNFSKVANFAPIEKSKSKPDEV